MEFGGLLYRVSGAMVLLLALLLVIAYGLKRWGKFTATHGSATRPLTILARQSLGPKHQVVLIQAGDQNLLLGLSPDGMKLLCNLSSSGLKADSRQISHNADFTETSFEKNLQDLEA